MTPINFPEANCKFGPPPDLDESQCQTIYAYQGQVKKGSVDGANVIVTCWKPSEEELLALCKGQPVFLSVLGQLPPHYICTSFEEALNIA